MLCHHIFTSTSTLKPSFPIVICNLIKTRIPGEVINRFRNGSASTLMRSCLNGQPRETAPTRWSKFDSAQCGVYEPVIILHAPVQTPRAGSIQLNAPFFQRDFHGSFRCNTLPPKSTRMVRERSPKRSVMTTKTALESSRNSSDC